MTALWIIYVTGVIASAAFAYVCTTPRHWAETVGTVVMCLLWFIVLGVCILVGIADIWNAYAYRKRGEATGDWRP